MCGRLCVSIVFSKCMGRCECMYVSVVVGSESITY